MEIRFDLECCKRFFPVGRIFRDKWSLMQSGISQFQNISKFDIFPTQLGILNSEIIVINQKVTYEGKT
jgi:hypothetical protein